MNIARLLVLVFLSSILNAAGPKRAMVIEDHTGAWCGWCVRGNQAAEELHAIYGDQFIPLAFHNDDSMALAIQDTMRRQFGITGYPTGLVNREQFTYDKVSSTNIDPDNWADACSQLKDATSNVGVNVDWVINSAGMLRGTVTTKFYANLNVQYAINVVLLEDSVTGSGKGWDQTNYLNGRKGYESHPYFYLPGSIKDYYHMNVVRAFVGGPTGDSTALPRVNANGDSVLYEFAIDLNLLNIQHRGNLWVAAMVVEHNSPYRVVNAASKGKRPTPKSIYWKLQTTSSSTYRKAMRSDSTTFSVMVHNTNDSAVTAITSIDQQNSSVPGDWRVRIEPEQQVIKAHDSAIARVTVVLGNAVGYASLKVVNKVRPFANILSLPTSVNLGVLSDGVKYVVAKFELDEGDDLRPFLESYNQLDAFPSQTAVVDCNDSTMKYYDFSSFDVLVLPESYATRTSLLFSEPMIAVVKQRAETAHPTLITSPMDLWFAADNYGKIASAQCKSLFEETLGFMGAKRTWGPWLWNSSERKYGEVGVQSFEGQDVAKGYDFMLNEIDSVHTLQTGWIDEIVILDTQRVHRILNAYGPYISDDSSTAAVWTQLKNTTLIFQGFGFEAIRDEPIRRSLLANYLGFLMKTTDVQPGELNDAQIQLGPNPASDLVTVRFQQRGSHARLRIVDVQGRTLQSATSSVVGESTQLMDLSSIPNGKYFVMIDDAGRYSLSKLVIAR